MPNRLSNETSPYLRQHADNPVDWRPWGEEAFAQARSEQKPIFLSIGYATCHWCHVMARESFENPAVAEVLNAHFIPIKVDREERPDVDRVYMSYVQSLTGHGGWPLSAWLTPDLKPFYGGTYYPPEDKQGRPGFRSILQAIAKGWKDDRPKLIAQAEESLATLRKQQPAEPGDQEGIEARLFEAGGTAYERGFNQLAQGFDPERGGFGGAPKFPRASNLNFLFRCAALQGPATEVGREAVHYAAHTLQQMARGGIHDHVGGGFHRYSVDQDWFVPHFEKMLYDQAQIALNAIEAWQATADERHAWLARDILEYVLRDLANPAGGFYSAEDADSETRDGHHAEGAFYVWTLDEIEEALGSDAEFFAGHFGVTVDGNVPPERDPQGEFSGRNILAPLGSLAETAKTNHLDLEQASDRLASCLERLRAVRSRRPRPGLDDKIITAWNGLMISALARAASVPAESLADRRQAYLGEAIRAATFIGRELSSPDRSTLFRSWRGRRGASAGFAEDYAYFIQGLLDLYEASWDASWLQWADRLQTRMDELFWDEERGGYFNSAAGASDILLRIKDDYDGAEPTPSSVAISNLLRLGSALGEPGVEDPRRTRALRTLEAFRARWVEYPHALPQMLSSLGRALEPPRHVVIAGNPDSPVFQELVQVLFERLGASRSLLAATGRPAEAWLAKRVPWIADMRPREGKAAAYVCENFSCQAPVTSAGELRRLLDLA